MAGIEHHVCEVCQTLDGDVSEKSCTYCSVCEAWICENDLDNWERRTDTAIKKMIRALSSTAEPTPD